MKPFFSIIVPCCDVEPYVRECLDSVLNQPFTDWECLIGVETSKDKTEEIAREYAAKDSRFKVFTGPRSGSCSVPRNTGIDMAEGEYVIFLDGDDLIVEGCLQRLHDKIAARPGADLYPCAYESFGDLKPDENPVTDNYKLDCPPEMSGDEATLLITEVGELMPDPRLQLTIFAHRFLCENGLKMIPGLRCQDAEFSPRALYRAKRVVPLHEIYYRYRKRLGAIQTSKKSIDHFYDDFAIIFHSLLSFHATVSLEKGFDRRISATWAKTWISKILFDWFYPSHIDRVSRQRRAETLKSMFADGFETLNVIDASNSFARRIAVKWMRIFIMHPALRWFSETFFRLYFAMVSARRSLRHRARNAVSTCR